MDPNFTAFKLQAGIALWKIIFAAVTCPFANMIVISRDIVPGGTLENFTKVFEEISSQEGSDLVMLLFLYVLANGLASIIGIAVIHDESAVMRQAAMLLVIPTVWLYFLGEGSEQFNWIELAGMSLVVAATVYYI